MSLTTNVPIFPGFQPGQTFVPPGTPIRAPKWNYKVTAQYKNFKQRAVNGLTRTTKYWPNRLRLFEWTYGYLYDDPTGVAYNLGPHSSFYSQPIPATDFQILDSFYGSLFGGGDQFLFQPPDSVVGGSATINAVFGSGNFWTLFFTTSPLFALGLYATFTGLTLATFLNGQTLEVLATGPNSITVYFVHAPQAKAAETGSAFVGQLLEPVDSNNNTELRRTIGSFPNLPLTGTPYSMTQVTESVQVINTTGLHVYANGVNVDGSYTITAADTVAPYSGLVLTFGAPPTPPLIAGFPYYFPCRFSEDTQEYENWLTMLYMASAVKFEQDRI